MEKHRIPFSSRESRRQFLYTGLAGVAGAAGAYVYANQFEVNRVSVTRKNIVIPNLPPALDGTVVSQLTDFHYEPDRNYDLMAAAVAASNAAKPDIVALTGDFITDSMRPFSPLLSHLAQLKSKHGVYSVLGNHDGWADKDHIMAQAFRKCGIEFLLNQGSQININGEKLFVMGTDSVWSGVIDLPKCYRGHTGEPVLALVHEPDVFDHIVGNYPVSLQLSGHTHGGQCRVPIVGYAPVKVRFGKKYIYGEHSLNDSKIFVSRGIGTTGLPVRFACPPEVAILTLKSDS